MDQLKTPLFHAVNEFAFRSKVSFHVPGHKNGGIFSDEGKAYYDNILAIDATELTGLDDLHAPVGPIRKAQMLLAALYGVKQSYFLVNGSTVGNLAMILASCGEGDTVLVARNCHKSILHGLMLAHCRPVFLAPTFYQEWSVAGGVDANLVEEALRKYPQTKAVIVTYPNYYGMAQDLSDIINLAHDKHIPVLVDEAHGAHFMIGSPFPASSLKFGADVVVHSAHKTLPAMTMGSFLHVNSSFVDASRVEFYLQMLQSSSPSYPIMTSLDLARAYLASYTRNDVEALVEKVNAFKTQLAAIPEIVVLAPPNEISLDPLKVTIHSTQGLTGYELQSRLEAAGIYTELADSQNVLFVLPLLKKEDKYPFADTVNKIGAAVKNQYGNDPMNNDVSWNHLEKITSLSLSYARMRHTPTKEVSFHEAIGHISSEMVIPYPPGIPLIMVGEKITVEKVTSLENLVTLHARFHGGSRITQGKLLIFDGLD